MQAFQSRLSEKNHFETCQVFVSRGLHYVLGRLDALVHVPAGQNHSSAASGQVTSCLKANSWNRVRDTQN